MKGEGDIPSHLSTDETWRDEPRKKRTTGGWPKGKPRKRVDDGRGVPRRNIRTREEVSSDGLLGNILGILDEIDRAPHGGIGRLVDRIRVLIELKGGL